MAKLIYLNPGRVAVLTWWEKPIVDYTLENEYLALLNKKSFQDLDEEESARLKELQEIKCEMGVSVVNVEILSSHPINMNEIKTSFKLSWDELNAINDAINELRDTHKGEKVLLPYAISLDHQN